MLLNRPDQVEARLAADDPLPPEDRIAVPAAQHVEDVYRRSLPRLRRFLGWRTSAQDAEDHAQQAFVRFLAVGDRASPVIHAENLLFQIARNLVLDDRKAALRHLRAAHVPLDDIDLAAPDQLAALEARDMLARLERVLLKLKPRTREIFLAVRIDGYSYAEIAARTGLSVKGVEKQMSRAIAHIDRALSRR